MSVRCSPGHEDATFLPNCCVVSPQEIQDRIRIVELYAKDRQFADFVRQHQAWVALFAFTFSSKLGDKDLGRTSQRGRGTLAKHFYMKGSGKIGFKIWFVWLAMALDAGAVWIYHCRVLRQPGPEVIQCADNPVTASSLAVRLHHVFHRGPECQTLCGRILGPPVPVNKRSCLLEGIKFFLLLLLLFCFRCSVMDTCRENSST